MNRLLTYRCSGLALALLALQACGGDNAEEPKLPQLTPARPAALASCDTLAAGTLTVAGQAIAEHCLITGQMHQRTSTVDGQTCAIGFQMRLPKAWNGSCLTAGQKTSAANIFGGLKNSAGTALYAGFPYDGGINSANWASWKLV